MKRFTVCCFSSRILKSRNRNPDKKLKESMEISRTDNEEPPKQNNNNVTSVIASDHTNVIVNHDFSSGMHSWHPNCCKAFVVTADSGVSHGGLAPSYVVVTNRKETWQGLEQDISSRVKPSCLYKVSAVVSVSGHVQGLVEVKATLKLQNQNSLTNYQSIAKTCVFKEKWVRLEGMFTLPILPEKIVFYLEGPSSGIDLLIQSVTIHRESSLSPERVTAEDEEDIVVNPNFENGLNNWSGRSCKIVLHDSMANGKIVPESGKAFASATERTQNWNGIQQEITGKVQRKRVYEATAVVRIYGNNVTNATVQVTLWVQNPNQRDQYIGITTVQATDKEWIQVKGKFLLNGSASRVVIYIEGPPPGTDILLNSLTVKHAEKVPPSPLPPIENPAFGVNILKNSHLSDGTTNGWFPLGNCTLSVAEGSPRILPPMARDSLGPHEPLSGHYMLATNRTQTWMGPAQVITDKLKLFLTYQISVWVKVGSGINTPQNVNVALGIDSQWVNGGQVEINDDKWHEIAGSFRIEKQPSKALVYVQGPSPGVDLMVAGLQIFPVDRLARIKHLRRQSDKIRKSDVILKFSGADSSILSGATVEVRQIRNSFPVGTCISRSNIDNEDFVDFFLKNFNWAVFANELKWYWTEPEKGKLNYQDADDLLNLCSSNNIQTRGHCIFWEVQATVQQWLQNMSQTELNTAVQNRLTDLLTRYKGKFKHYDVNNEMLHGSFYQDKLGKDIRVNMFHTAHQLDPSATLFVNDYHIEDGCDPRSCPEKYIQQILDLQEKGAPVGGIGIQGHIDSPVGPIVCSALDRLGILGLPIWFTELDVSSINEHVRGDDLEVMMWEAFGHAAVEGIMLWGFWELFMSRDNSHLVNAEGDVNEAGKRFLAVKKAWLSHANGHIDQNGAFAFRGYHGNYAVEVITSSSQKLLLKTFVVEKGDSAQVITVDLQGL
uniref:Endo-1,4-beta-xylanase A n=1 Tax=Noccaea caerulescens TaxID=107243 RepID=A0A1J3JJZ3_NOCCA